MNPKGLDKSLPVSMGAGFLFSVLGNLFGDMNVGMVTLIACMTFDYITGVMIALIWKKSNKSENGGLSSKTGWKGLCRKFVIFVFVLIANRLDIIFETDYIRNAVIIGFIINEIISLVENAGIMGVPLPKALVNAVDMLKEKTTTVKLDVTNEDLEDESGCPAQCKDCNRRK